MMERNICYAFCRLFPSCLIDYLKHIMNSCAPPHTHTSTYMHKHANRDMHVLKALPSEAEGKRAGPARRPALQRKSHLRIPFLGIARPQSEFPHSCVCERFICSHDRSAYSDAGKYVDRPWEYINSSQTHECECGNWD
jgi:hypothetical protein